MPGSCLGTVVDSVRPFWRKCVKEPDGDIREEIVRGEVWYG